MLKMLRVLWNRAAGFRAALLRISAAELLLMTAETVVPILLWYPMLSAWMAGEREQGLLWLLLLQLSLWLLAAGAQKAGGERRKLALSMNQMLKRSLAAGAMRLSYERFSRGEVQGLLSQADDLLSDEFDYADGLDWLILQAKQLLALLFSGGALLAVLAAPVRRPLFSAVWEQGFRGQALNLLFFFLPAGLSLWFLRRGFLRRRAEQEGLLEQHTAVERAFSYYRNEVVYSFAHYPLHQSLNLLPLLSRRIRENAAANERYFARSRDLSLRSRQRSILLSTGNTLLIFALVGYKCLGGAILPAACLTAFESLRLFFLSCFSLGEQSQELRARLPFMEKIEEAMRTAEETGAGNRSAQEEAADGAGRSPGMPAGGSSAAESAVLPAEDKTAGTSAPRGSVSGWELRGVGYTYPGSGKPVLRGVNLRIPERGFRVLVGENGAGKSTLVLLLAGLLEAAEGEILFRGRPLQTVDREEYRAVLGVMFQESGLLPLPLGDVLGLPGADGEEAVSRLAEWGLTEERAREFLQADSARLQAASGGEKSKLLLARSFFSDRSFLICDEPSAALDAHSEQELHRRILAEAGQQRGVLLVSHRLGICPQADEIIVMEEGRIAGTGTHGRLLENCAVYRRLWEAQKSLYGQEEME